MDSAYWRMAPLACLWSRCVQIANGSQHTQDRLAESPIGSLPLSGMLAVMEAGLR